jgi:hypothetical protein
MSINGKDDTFDYELANISPEQENLIKKCFTIKPIRNYLTDALDPLEFAIKFEPLKPFKQTIDLNINRKSGGRWRYIIIINFYTIYSNN